MDRIKAGKLLASDKPGLGNLFAITGRMNCALSLADRKPN